MNIHNIFNIFETQSKELSVSTNTDKDILFTLNVIKNIFKLEYKVKKEISTLFGHTDEDLINYIFYNKVYFWLSNVNPNNVNHQNVLIANIDPTITNNLKTIISFFEQYEEYEKCSHIKNIYEIIEIFSK